MADAAQSLEQAGAECLLICTNTMHKMASEVQASIDIPLIHIADSTAPAIKEAKVSSPLLLSTRYTMEQDFYKGYLKEHHNIDVVTPDEEARTVIHRIIYEELCRGVVLPESKDRYLSIVERAGTDGVIFGCTEVGLLLSQSDLTVPAFDTTQLHAQAAINYALSDR